MKKIQRDQIEKVLEEIRPFLITDGGNIKLIGIDKSIVKVKFEGNCFDCSVNETTLKFGVETAIKKYIPDVTEVISVEE